MVADDLVIAANSPSDLQHGVSIAALDSQRQRYSFNVDKTKIVSLNSKNDPSCLLSKETHRHVNLRNPPRHLPKQQEHQQRHYKCSNH